MKKRPASKSTKASAITALDQSFACCRRIETLAELLVTCDRLEKSCLLSPHLIGHAGFMIAEEIIKLRQRLSQLPRD